MNIDKYFVTMINSSKSFTLLKSREKVSNSIQDLARFNFGL